MDNLMKCRNNMQIYTLQFPQIQLKNRIEFLNFAQRCVIEFAFRNEEIFLSQGLTPESFHKNASLPQRSPQNREPVHIHSLMLGGKFALRAYGEEAVATLQLWSQLFLDENPEYRHHIVEHIEHIEIERLGKPLYYVSKNWIPFREMVLLDGYYVNRGVDYSKVKSERDRPHFALNKQLFCNLGTFLRSHNVKIHRDIELVQYPSAPKKCIALRTRENGKVINKYKDAFTVKIKTHVCLPMYFSLGQNVGYGNGLFVRV